jgi:hypothetical protein
MRIDDMRAAFYPWPCLPAITARNSFNTRALTTELSCDAIHSLTA